MAEPYQLYSAHLDGYQLSPAEAKRLSSWVAASPANAALVVELSILHECVDSRMCMPQMLEELALADDVELRSEIAHSLDALWSAVEETSRTVEPRTFHPTHSTAGGWMAATGVAAMLLVSMIAYSLLMPERSPTTPPLANNQSTPTLPAVVPSPETAHSGERPALLVATIDSAVNVAWSKNVEPAAGGVLLQNEVLDIPSGVLQVRTIVGHTIVIEGPTRLKFESPQRVHLVQGKVSGLVGEHSGSLEFITPSAHVVDLGTELGVSVDDKNKTKVAVYDGAVQVSGPDEHPSKRMTLLHGYEADVESDGTFLDGPRRSPHERGFVRVDEVKLMVEGEAGKQRSAAIAKYYELLRSGHLLAYQSFDKSSAGRDLTFGFDEPALDGTAQHSIVDNLVTKDDGESGAVLVSSDGHVVCPLNMSSRAWSMLADEQGFVGRAGTELWISWRDQSVQASIPDAQYAGLSLTTDVLDDTRDVFFGRVHTTVALGLQMNRGREAKFRERKLLPVDADGQVHLWTARVQCNGQGGSVALWLDVPFAELDPDAPQLEGTPQHLKFDRVRLAIDEQSAGWAFDDLMIAKSLESLIAAEELLSRELATPEP